MKVLWVRKLSNLKWDYDHALIAVKPFLRKPKIYLLCGPEAYSLPFFKPVGFWTWHSLNILLGQWNEKQNSKKRFNKHYKEWLKDPIVDECLSTQYGIATKQTTEEGKTDEESFNKLRDSFKEYL